MNNDVEKNIKECFDNWLFHNFADKVEELNEKFAKGYNPEPVVVADVPYVEVETVTTNKTIGWKNEKCYCNRN